MEDTRIPSYVGLFYYYITTFDQEVKVLVTSYTLKVFNLLIDWPIHQVISIKSVQYSYTQHQVPDASLVVMPIANSSAEAVFWLCLYALLEGKRRYLFVLISAFFAFLIPIQVLQWMFLVTNKAIPADPLSEELGYPCTFEPPAEDRFRLYSAGGYLALGRSAFILVAAFVTLFVRYRRQNNNLIKALRREGGMHYITALIMNLFSGITRSPNTPLHDKYNIVTSIRFLLVPIFADRLLLTMQKLEDAGARTAVSTLMFDHQSEHSSTDSSSEYYAEADSDGLPLGEPASSEGSPVVSKVEEKVQSPMYGDRSGDLCT
ncbi:hypothetical protein DFP72DRAFT_1141117 [Ephemerocybe angulata]|uniref:Uncharacterized protein n=1 Tax=Ephemerocybe angulata TaxID=980116 RepID=A0A8H6IDZ6_9AGAR|nr:hypothetical protein DFP72DRAFT_1141117 [Tulosesus angulatus]